MIDPIKSPSGALIDPNFESLIPFLIGDPPHQHFFLDQNELYCVRYSCGGCSLVDSCEFKDKELLSKSPITHPRRGVGPEDVSFLVLRPKGDLEETLDYCEKVLGIPYAVLAYDESNVHSFLQDPDPEGLWIGKEQFRYFGTEDQFNNEEYSKIFSVVDSYDPSHRFMSMDFSAIEPRVSTLASMEPLWVQVFKGSPQIVYKEVDLRDTKVFPEYVNVFDNKLWCWLVKDNYDNQCKGCPLVDKCTTVKDHYHYVPGDWHMINASGLYGTEFDRAIVESDKESLVTMREASKRAGLALSYGGSYITLAKTLKVTESRSKNLISNFFMKLNTYKEYMRGQINTVMMDKVVYSLFGRVRDMSQWTESKLGKDKGFAKRTALNYPIQTTACELLKIAQIRVDNWINDNKLSPYAGLNAPLRVDLFRGWYNNVILSPLLSVHDEEGFLIRDDKVLSIVPDLYRIMKLEDVLEKFKVDFTLELDIEYDLSRTWTSIQSVPTSLILLLGSLKEKQQTAVNDDNEILVINVDELSNQKEVLGHFEKVHGEVQQGSYFYEGSDKIYPVAIRFKNRDDLVSFCVDLPKSFLSSKNIPYNEESLV